MSMFRNLGDVVQRTIAMRYLQKVSRQHIRDCPRMAVFSFDFIGHHINIFGRYERSLLDQLAKLIRRRGRCGVALDVGANIGNHSLFFSDLFETVHAFEPNASILPLLQYNVRDRPNISVHPFGASSSDGIVNAAVPASNAGGGHIVSGAEASDDGLVEFEVRRLDRLPELRELPSIDLVKLDVEGHEASAIAGLADLIDRHGPLIVLEQNAEEVRDGSTEAIEQLRKLGYDRLYEVTSGKSRLSRSLPSVLRQPLRLAEIALASDSIDGAIAPVGPLQTRRYPMLLANRGPLDLRD